MQLPDFREGSNIRLCQNDMFLVYIIFQEREIIPINFLPPSLPSIILMSFCKNMYLTLTFIFYPVPNNNNKIFIYTDKKGH